METEGTDLLITGGRVYTADPWHPWAEAVLLRDDRIRHVGSLVDATDRAGRGATRIEVPGALILPGLNDSHIHTDWGGLSLRMLNLEGVVAAPELQGRLRRFAEEHPEREWIEGTGLGYEPLLHDPAPRLTLDAVVPDRPVYLRGFDWHTSYANTVALERAGILRGAEVPRPNEVVLGADGLATGVLKERLAYTLVEECIPSLSDAQRDEWLVAAMRYLNGFGITSVQNMHGDPETLERYLRLEARGGQSVRALHHMRVREDTPDALLPEFAALTRRHDAGWNRVAGIKMFMDGVVESKTAMLLAPYSDGSGDLGVPDMDPEAHRRFTVQADALGMRVATHAIGDRAVRRTLDHYQEAAERNGTVRQRRHRVEHIELLDRGDLERFARWGVTASLQPLHCAPTIDPYLTLYTELLGPDRLPGAFVWRSIVETGAAVAFGSDWPVVTPDPFQGLHVALTRTNIAGAPRGGFELQQAITLAQALDAYTRVAAYAEFQEHEKGVLRAGMLADLTVFSRDLFMLGADAVLGTEALLTVVGGRIVHRHPSVG